MKSYNYVKIINKVIKINEIFFFLKGKDRMKDLRLKMKDKGVEGCKTSCRGRNVAVLILLNLTCDENRVKYKLEVVLVVCRWARLIDDLNFGFSGSKMKG